jgi:alpha-L-fucosidase
MNRNFLFLVIAFCVVKISIAQTYTPAQSNLAARENFQDNKFGLFIHWGVYSLMGDGEWVMFNKKIPYDSYKRLADSFNPQDFNAKSWVQMTKNAGMKYITITSRHHDGFSMFKTGASSYNIVDATPYHKDPLIELANEAQKEGIALHFYYSLVDWGRTDYAFGKKIVNGKPEDTDWDSYITFMKKQLTELITNYPNVKAIWFDGNWERPNVDWHYDEVYSLIHRLNPQILVGNNHHMGPLSGEDFQMFEKDLPGENKTGYRKNDKIANLPLETCETMNNSWGFNINDRNYKSVKQLIQMLVNAAGRNANFLLNVSPMPNGKIQPEFTDTLALIGKWMQANGETIYGTRGNTAPPQTWGAVTSKDKTLFAHVLTQPKQNFIFIPAINQPVKSVVLFADKTPLKFRQQAEGVFIYIDNVQLNDIDTIIQLTMK